MSETDPWHDQASSEKGQANGYAALGADGKVPAAQLPAGGGAAWGAITGTLADQTDVQAAIDAKSTLAAALLAAWPVGAVYLSVISTSPATLFGGTWSAIAAGRVLVGLDSGDTDFDTAEEQGGAKTVTLTEAQIPVHTHTQNAHNHTQDQHRHAHLRERSATTGGATTQIARTADTSSTVDSAVVTEYATATNQAATAVNQNTGGGGSHSNVQPYFVVYIWKRTA